ncbi:hypothetical protein QKW52_03325 [Bacillus sonorensis]|nr:hypothetical protein [Bacillus sonorensis]
MSVNTGRSERLFGLVAVFMMDRIRAIEDIAMKDRFQAERL